jgi:hypothetical protein
VCSNFDAKIDDHIHTKRLSSLGLCFLLSSILVFGSVFAVLILPVYAQDEYVVFPETVSVSSTDLVPHNFILKAISKQNGDVEKVSGFALDPANVISVLEGDILSATSTDQSIVFEQAKVKSSTDSLFELQKTTTQGQQQNGGFSLAGLAPGVYTLDIIAVKNNAKAAYEGILVIGQNPESQEVQQVVEREIIEVERDTPTTIIPVFQPPSNPQPPIILQQQQQQPAAIPLGGQAPINPPAPQALAGQQPPIPAAAAPQSGTPPDGTPCTGVDNVDIGVYKNGKCTPETLPPEPPQAPATAAAAPQGTIPSCILTADCPPSPPPQALAAQQLPPTGSAELDNENGSDPCLLDPSSPECQIVDTFDTPSTDPNDPLAGEGGEGTEGTDELARESQDTDGEDSDSESDGGGEEGDSEGDSDSGDGGGEEPGDDEGPAPEPIGDPAPDGHGHELRGREGRDQEGDLERGGAEVLGIEGEQGENDPEPDHVHENRDEQDRQAGGLQHAGRIMGSETLVLWSTTR